MDNKINLLKLIRENQIAAIAVAAIIAVFVVYAVVFVPLTKTIREKYALCRTCEIQVSDARNLINYARNIDKSYGGRVLISEREAAAGIDELIKHGKSLGIDFVSVKPRNLITKEGMAYKILPVELDIESAYKQFVSFMGSIDELKKAIVAVDAFDITPDTQDRNRLHVKMVINIYLSKKESGTEEP